MFTFNSGGAGHVSTRNERLHLLGYRTPYFLALLAFEQRLRFVRLFQFYLTEVQQAQLGEFVYHVQPVVLFGGDGVVQ